MRKPLILFVMFPRALGTRGPSVSPKPKRPRRDAVMFDGYIHAQMRRTQMTSYMIIGSARPKKGAESVALQVVHLPGTTEFAFLLLQ